MSTMCQPLVLCALFGCVTSSLFAATSIADRVAIHTDDGKLPASFSAGNLSAPLKCLADGRPPKCDAWMMDVTDDGVGDVLIMDDDTMWVFTERPAGKWLAVGQWNLAGACQAFFDAARRGQFQAVTPVRPRWPDLEIAGQRFAFHESGAPPPPCPR